MAWVMVYWATRQKTPSLEWNNCLCSLGSYSQSFLVSFVRIPNFCQAVIRMFNCLSSNKGETTVSFPRWLVTFAQIGQAQNILTEFIPKMKSGTHICISNVVKVSSTPLFKPSTDAPTRSNNQQYFPKSKWFNPGNEVSVVDLQILFGVISNACLDAIWKWYNLEDICHYLSLYGRCSTHHYPI